MLYGIHIIIIIIDSEPSPYESPRPNSAERVAGPTLIPNNGHLYQPTGNTVANTDNDYRIGQDRYQVHFFPTEIEYNIGLIPE